MISSVVGNDKVDYKSAKKASTLDVPPDLTQLQKDNRYSLPDSSNGVATASGYNAAAQRRGAARPSSWAPTAGRVVPVTAGNMQGRAQRQPALAGGQADAGTAVAAAQAVLGRFGLHDGQRTPTTGIMETDWAENRAKIPQDLIRNTIGKVFDSVYSTGERDKFRTRLERRADGATEIYISHRGVEEVVTGRDKETTTWTAASRTIRAWKRNSWPS